MKREEDPRFRNINRKIGIFIVLAIAGTLAAVTLFGLENDIFTKKYVLRFTVDRGTGFTKGMPVKLSGFRVGRVTAIALNDQAQVDVNIEVDHKYRKWIRKNSVVKLIKEGLVGDSIIDISVGSPDTPELSHNDAIPYVKTKALDEVAEELATSIKPVLTEIRDIVAYINHPKGELKTTIHNLEVLTRNLDGTRQQADSLLASASIAVNGISDQSSTLLTSAHTTLTKLDPTITRINSTMETVDTRLPQIMVKADSMLDKLTQVTGETHQLTTRVYPRIPGLLSQVEDLLLSTNQLMNTVDQSWLLGGGSSPASSSHLFIRGDSYE